MTELAQLKRPVPRWWRIWQGPVLGILAAVTCAVVLWAAMAPVTTLIYVVFAFWAFAVIGIAWLVFAVVGWLLYRTVRRSLIAPVLVVMTAVLVVFSVPFHVGFVLSKNRLTELAATCQPSGADNRAGVYAIRQVVAISDSGCLFYTDGGFMDKVGVVYLPGGPTDAFRAQFESIELSHVSGDWYRFSAGW
ncbi:hypothetical protein [Williamsia muralis]|uniref:Uncharacterized protein n=1 Tax=Williamsia marianensis TaxID=85044 RepID=A0ABU4EP79_WILMA|nr:hypothetical protein [Williamsia muralis]MDV7133060.1 hypothetical protein [Williamsia muralis]